MAFTYGFYNSSRGDRRYNAEQVSEIFDGILEDGIIPSIGQKFAVTAANSGMQIKIGTGRAWFDHTWSKNDSVMVLSLHSSDVSRNRYDAVVLEINHNDNVRANSIKIVSGSPDVNATKPTLVNTDKVHQYPLAYVLVKAGVEVIKAQDIENMVGRFPTVFATGILETTSLDDLWSQWEGEWDNWFENIKFQLSDNVVANLQLQIEQVKNSVPVKATSSESVGGSNNSKYMTPYGVKLAIDSNSKKNIVVDQRGQWLMVTTSNVIPIKASIDTCRSIDLVTKDYYISYQLSNSGSGNTIEFTVINKSNLSVYRSLVSVPFSSSDSSIHVLVIKETNYILMSYSQGILKFSFNSTSVTKSTLIDYISSDTTYYTMLAYINVSYSVYMVQFSGLCRVYRISNNSNASPTEYIWSTPRSSYLDFFTYDSTSLIHFYRSGSSGSVTVERLVISTFSSEKAGTVSVPEYSLARMYSFDYDRTINYGIVFGKGESSSVDDDLILFTAHGNTFNFYRMNGASTASGYSGNSKIDIKHHVIWDADVDVNGTTIMRWSYSDNSISTLILPWRGYTYNNVSDSTTYYNIVSLVAEGYVLEGYATSDNGLWMDADVMVSYIPYSGSAFYMVELPTGNAQSIRLFSPTPKSVGRVHSLSDTEFSFETGRVTIYDINSTKMFGVYTYGEGGGGGGGGA